MESATDTLAEAGYSVDYYSGEEVTVDFYRDLQTAGYELIIFRTHSARLVGEYAGDSYDEALLFTSEPYERVSIRVTFPKLSEQPNEITLERWIPWDQVYGVDEDAAEEEEGL